MLPRFFLLGFVFFGTMVGGAQAGNSLGVTCIEGGRVVHKEELPANAGQEERLFVRAKYPDALCLFIEEAPSIEPSDTYASGFDVMSSGRVAGATNENTPSNDLATALAMISSGQPAPAMPIDLTDAMQKFREETGTIEPRIQSESRKLLNLTIGIYRSVPTSDVISHWKAMQKEGASLKNLTPTLTNIADITMLSVENITDENADAICEDAAILGSGCIAFY